MLPNTVRVVAGFDHCVILMANFSYLNPYCPFLKSRDCILGLSTGPGTQAVASILMKAGGGGG